MTVEAASSASANREPKAEERVHHQAQVQGQSVRTATMCLGSVPILAIAFDERISACLAPLAALSMDIRHSATSVAKREYGSRR